MASVLQFVILSMFVAHLCNAQKKLSEHDALVLINIANAVNDAVKATCFKEFGTLLNKYDEDTKIDGLCMDLKNKKFGFTNVCTAKEQSVSQNKVCDLVDASRKRRVALVVEYGKVFNGLSSACKAVLPRGSSLATWFYIEDFCKKSATTNKAAIEKACPNGGNDKVREALVCARAPALVSGLLAIGMSLVAALFNKL